MITTAPEGAIMAWHFARRSLQMRHDDPRLITVGASFSTPSPDRTVHPHCYGYHGSVALIDALAYAPGPMLSRVEIWGDLVLHERVCAGRNRTHHQVIDATDGLIDGALAVISALVNDSAVTPPEHFADLSGFLATLKDWIAGKHEDTTVYDILQKHRPMFEKDAKGMLARRPVWSKLHHKQRLFLTVHDLVDAMDFGGNQEWRVSHLFGATQKAARMIMDQEPFTTESNEQHWAAGVRLHVLRLGKLITDCVTKEAAVDHTA